MTFCADGIVFVQDEVFVQSHRKWVEYEMACVALSPHPRRLVRAVSPAGIARADRRRRVGERLASGR